VRAQLQEAEQLGGIPRAGRRRRTGSPPRAPAGLPPLPAPGDPAKIAAAIIASADEPEAPLRLTLGSDAYALATAALRGRLDALEAGRDLAHSTDADDLTVTAG
jgi:hypothetical protein